MKRILLLLMTVVLVSNFSFAQIARHALGLRFGTDDGFGTEISYQHGLNGNNRLEFDLGFNNYHENYMNYRYNYTSWGLSGLYHWVYKLDSNFNWYIGPGAKIGSWSYDTGYNDYRYSNGMFLAAAGDIGIEYNFPVGFQLALNARPEIGLINHGTAINVGLAVRYRFR